MSQIRFVSELGDALDVALAAERPAPALPRLRVLRGRARLVAVLAVLALSGSIATAATLLSSSSTTFIARGLTCVNGTPTRATVDASDVEQYGRSPLMACASVLRLPAAKLLACTSSRFGVIVYERHGDVADECRSGDMTAGLPPGYAAATARVSRLQHDLNRLYASRECFSVRALEAATQVELNQLGFVGWRTRLMRIPKPVPSDGSCAAYPATGNRRSDATAALDGPDRVVMIVSGPSRRVANLLSSFTTRLLAATGRRCYTLAALQSYVRTTVAHSDAPAPVRFAAYSEPRYTGLGLGRQPRYNAGCAVVVNIETAPDGRTFLVELWQRGKPPVPTTDHAFGLVPLGAFQPVLKSN